MDDAVSAVDGVVGRECGTCGTVAGPADRFCEHCGADLPTDGRATSSGVAVPADPAPPEGPDTATAPMLAPARRQPPRPPCRECGGAVDSDGYCTQCGAKAPSERDHFAVAPAPGVAAVSDRGLRHHRNEDAAAVLADGAGRAALVVCDGVSTSVSSDVASLAAARAAADVLGTGSVGLAEGSARIAALGVRVTQAAAAAAAAVAAATPDDDAESPPSCTFVAAAVQDPVVVVGVVGDSRAYWLPDVGEPQLLTIDDSVAGQQIAAGRPRAEAEAGPQAHAITRWLGVDSPDQTPRLTPLEVDGPGWLLLCSDGLWNYCSEPAALGEVAARALGGAGGDPLTAASALVDWANDQGGHDNITVVLARLGGATGATGTTGMASVAGTASAEGTDQR